MTDPVRTDHRFTSTYRLQMHGDYRLTDAEAVVDYLDALGIGDVYLSPYLSARPGSRHGYDVFDHGRINPEIGTDEEHARLCASLAGRGMGRVIDVVPNHMGIAGGNPIWREMLEDGPGSKAARFFDVDWEPLGPGPRGKVLLPVLGDAYGRVLESGQLELRSEEGAFVVVYHEARFPIAPRTYDLVLERCAAVSDGEAADALRGLLEAVRALPPVDAGEAYEAAKVRIVSRFARLSAGGEGAAMIEAAVACFRGIQGDARSFDALHDLLELQYYRLAYWRVASEELNYRRFFDVTDLAGIRVEDPAVFESVHELLFDWLRQGGVTALRIDHPDGLADPFGYLSNLQASIGEGFPVLVEKILSAGETLPAEWPVAGTVGYEYLNMLNGLFVDPAGRAGIDAAYEEFTGDREPFAEVVYQSKSLVLRTSLAVELDRLARRLDRLTERDRVSRDLTLAELRKGLGEVICAFPVYRTYVRPGEAVSDRDRGVIASAVEAARRRNEDVAPRVFDVIGAALRREERDGADEAERAELAEFVQRFQQLTGPATAKGIEDTAFYRQVRLASLNEVGGEPDRFGVAPAEFHAFCAGRQREWPAALSTTATHDTKRGEDTRIRIDVLSEIPEEWRAGIERWSAINRGKRVEVRGRPAPDGVEEYLFYQVLLGSWPFDGGDVGVPEGLAVRLQEYMRKAVREAKRNTGWTDPDPSYVDAISAFVEGVLHGDGAEEFLADFVPFQGRVARVGVVHSLAQCLIKAAAPGVPDVYQGCELWDFSLVDPDNRRAVDYGRRRELLGRIRGALEAGESRRELAARLFADSEDGAIKLYTLWTALGDRRTAGELYADGAYGPLETVGALADRVVAFARSHEGGHVVVVAPRLVAPLMGDDGLVAPIGLEVWGDTAIRLAELPGRWRNVLTDELVLVKAGGDLGLGEVFATLPLGLLVPDGG